MNAYDYLITGGATDTRQGDMALGHLLEHLRRSPHAATVTAAGPWPTGWRQHGAALITPAGTLIELTRDDYALGVRGPEFTFTVARVGSLTPGVDREAPYHLVAANVAPLRAAIWYVLEEFGTDADRDARGALL